MRGREAEFALCPVFGVLLPEARNHKSSGNGDLLTECRNVAVFLTGLAAVSVRLGMNC